MTVRARNQGGPVEWIVDTLEERDLIKEHGPGTLCHVVATGQRYSADLDGNWQSMAGSGGGGGDHPDLATHVALGLSGTAHNHDAAYSAAGHGHTHDHDGTYEPVHAHPYSASGHDHDADYEALGHTHPGGDHPDLATHDALGLATDSALTSGLAGKADTHGHPYEASGAVSTHEAAGNPHPTYETSAEAQAKVDTHAGLSDAHPGYLTPAEHTTGLSGHHTAFVQADHDGLPNPHHSNTNDHVRSHSITSGSDHTFPGGSTTYLRADGTFATPAGGGGGEAFPIGSVFISVVSTDPSTLLGYGTWSAFGAGRVLVGIDTADASFDTEEETGGSKTHTLSEAEMPAHTHVETNNSLNTGGAVGFAARDTSTNNQVATGYSTESTGGGGAHNNLQPYIVVRMWKRTA